MQVKKVLIIGLGKIGQLKAKIYKELGYFVIGLDKDTNINKLTNMDEIVHSLSMLDLNSINHIDICVPTKYHIILLQDLLSLKNTARIIVEKPLCSNHADLEVFQKLGTIYPNAEIIYSENYLFSSTLDKLEELIKQYSLTVQLIIAEFSKDRKSDILAGRFVDGELEGFGIEIPHILAILEYLGFGISQVNSLETDDLIVGRELLPRQGNIKITAETIKNQTIEIFQSLDGRINHVSEFYKIPHIGSTINRTYRILELLCKEGFVIAVQFEPIEDLQRFISRVTLYKDKQLIVSFDYADNTLRTLITNIEDQNDKRFRILSQSSFPVKITKLLLNLQKISLQNINSMNSLNNISLEANDSNMSSR